MLEVTNDRIGEEALQKRGTGLAAAIHAIKSAVQAYRAKAAEEAVSFDHVPLERSHLATLMDFAQTGPGDGPDERRAVGNVSEWLDRDI